MNREHLQSLRNAYRDGLLNDVVPFWLRHALDREHGGYFTCLDRDGTVIDTDKAIWLQGRFSWLLSELYNTVEARADWLDAARLGIEFLERHGYDRAGDGRLFFHVTREGRPIRKRRYNFSEGFAAIGYAACARAAGSEYHRDKAIELFRNFVAYNTTPGAMPPKFTDERPLQGMGFR
ncbi:MAG: AGE family epimerase/isomerase, partial [Kiritimatiellaeota bacterium]|nr:AGE family epimerase/isomerase [Kiritimatiellota bacterium]